MSWVKRKTTSCRRNEGHCWSCEFHLSLFDFIRFCVDFFDFRCKPVAFNRMLTRIKNLHKIRIDQRICPSVVVKSHLLLLDCIGGSIVLTTSLIMSSIRVAMSLPFFDRISTYMVSIWQVRSNFSMVILPKKPVPPVKNTALFR